MLIRDPLYFHRTTLAETLLANFKSGIFHALTLFAPRRMGKTQFLLNDVAPLAEAQGFSVFYHSFMDSDNDFRASLQLFSENKNNKVKGWFSQIKGISIAGSGVELDKQTAAEPISQIIARLADEKKPTLLLLDEIQELARGVNNSNVVGSLRTGLDLYRDKIKVIFTGSSTNDLRVMFNNGKAPFFHFSHQIDFPPLGRDFSDFLADIYQQRTEVFIDKTALYQIFLRLNQTPMYLRQIIERMIINPALTLEQATEIQLTQSGTGADYHKVWQALTALDRQLLLAVAQGETALYSERNRHELASRLGVAEVKTSSIQGSVRKLENRELLTRDTKNKQSINESAFKTWILDQSVSQN
ncbi:ATP-binding protein [Testudinibacter aquarius]|uniref:AAA+ ATPase superfamily predicted ATPase n=1 Tax=Testudinibacter aquarius TaxID=1524974 RepID=A0A4R3XW05_9PAST|nr:ATP-binding protein [Testudinibacter aquarius]KAE9531012.1 selenocysteine synthase [Testudinibacter aquarius]TCV83370.1 AAA+ ATPase superfamily predicted ATPase [Testudinibacter aquarius]TNG91170.1 ATP-binding protein [Testudinibacter aquarius]